MTSDKAIRPLVGLLPDIIILADDGLINQQAGMCPAASWRAGLSPVHTERVSQAALAHVLACSVRAQCVCTHMMRHRAPVATAALRMLVVQKQTFQPTSPSTRGGHVRPITAMMIMPSLHLWVLSVWVAADAAYASAKCPAWCMGKMYGHTALPSTVIATDEQAGDCYNASVSTVNQCFSWAACASCPGYSSHPLMA